MYDGDNIETFGCLNDSADAAKRTDVTWSDGNLDWKFEKDETFERLKCRKCGSVNFEVLAHSDILITAVQCSKCKMYYIAHGG